MVVVIAILLLYYSAMAQRGVYVYDLWMSKQWLFFGWAGGAHCGGMWQMPTHNSIQGEERREVSVALSCYVPCYNQTREANQFEVTTKHNTA